MCRAFAGTAGLPGVALAKQGVPPAAAKQMKQSKSQSKQADVRTFHTIAARAVPLLFKLALGLLLSRAGETPWLR
jgi:hypothetical protein